MKTLLVLIWMLSTLWRVSELFDGDPTDTIIRFLTINYFLSACPSAKQTSRTSWILSRAFSFRFFFWTYKCFYISQCNFVDLTTEWNAGQVRSKTIRGNYLRLGSHRQWRVCHAGRLIPERHTKRKTVWVSEDFCSVLWEIFVRTDSGTSWKSEALSRNSTFPAQSALSKEDKGLACAQFWGNPLA